MPRPNLRVEIGEWFKVRKVEPIWALDAEIGELGQGFGAQANNAALLPFPTEALIYLFHEGALLFLDGGMLDLGLVRDSSLNQRNSVETFTETFEAVARVGAEALRLRVDICVDGTVAPAGSAISCVTGS